jgi:hypothetical protein
MPHTGQSLPQIGHIRKYAHNLPRKILIVYVKSFLVLYTTANII